MKKLYFLEQAISSNEYLSGNPALCVIDEDDIMNLRKVRAVQRINRAFAGKFGIEIEGGELSVFDTSNDLIDNREYDADPRISKGLYDEIIENFSHTDEVRNNGCTLSLSQYDFNETVYATVYGKWCNSKVQIALPSIDKLTKMIEYEN